MGYLGKELFPFLMLSLEGPWNHRGRDEGVGRKAPAHFQSVRSCLVLSDTGKARMTGLINCNFGLMNGKEREGEGRQLKGSTKSQVNTTAVAREGKSQEARGFEPNEGCGKDPAEAQMSSKSVGKERMSAADCAPNQTSDFLCFSDDRISSRRGAWCVCV